MTTAGWYGDPTRAGRLRYWDGATWTAHVSVDGQVAQEPIQGLPPAPPSPSPPAPRPLEEQRAFGAPVTVLGRVGLGVAAAGAVVCAAATGSLAVVQEDLGGAAIEIAGAGWVVACVVVAVLCLACAVAPWPWARIAGAGIAAAFASFSGFALIVSRGDEVFVQGLDVSLDTGGWLVFLGTVLLFAGTGLALAGVGRSPSKRVAGARPGNGLAVSALVLGIIGVPLYVTAAPAVGLALWALDDVRAGVGSGRGMAIAGLVLGIVALSLWCLGIVLGMLLAQP